MSSSEKKNSVKKTASRARAAARADKPDRAARLQTRFVEVGDQVLRVGRRPGRGQGIPLLMFNGIGANLELLDQFVQELPGVEVIAFDVPGVGGSAMPRWPYRLAHIAALGDRLLTELGHEGPVDVLGVSWGGAAAQQFARSFGDRCRRLVLAATSAGTVMVPGRWSVIRKMSNPRRYYDAQYMARIGADIYGGAFRRAPELLREHAKHIRPPRGRGYLYQMLATLGWTSAWWLHTLRQPALVLAGTDDPVVPVLNAHLLHLLIPNAQLHVVDDGHLFLLSRAKDMARVIADFLAADDDALKRQSWQRPITV